MLSGGIIGILGINIRFPAIIGITCKPSRWVVFPDSRSRSGCVPSPHIVTCISIFCCFIFIRKMLGYFARHSSLRLDLMHDCCT